MRPPVEQPTIRHSRFDETVESHPAYAQIGASRISGRGVLYGSDFVHQHFVRIRIAKSELSRNLSTNWPHASAQYIEVDLSEAQWATFVSSMNVGDGVQCTLRHLKGEFTPDLPEPVKRVDQFKAEALQRCEGGIKELDELAAVINEMNISQRAKGELCSRIRIAKAQLSDGLPFVLDMFGEHMEKTVERAKVEVNAYVAQNVMRAGLAALGGEQPLLALGNDGGMTP